MTLSSCPNLFLLEANYPELPPLLGQPRHLARQEESLNNTELLVQHNDVAFLRKVTS